MGRNLRRTVATQVLILGALLLVLSSGYLLIRWRASLLPDPNRCSFAEICRWIVLRDLSKETEATQVAITRQLEAYTDELRGGSSDSWFLLESDRRRISQNSLLLKRVWFLDKVRTYPTLPNDQREPFLHRGLAFVEVFLAKMNQGSASSNSEQDSGLQRELNDLIANLPETEKLNGQRLINDAFVCWLHTGDLKVLSMEDRIALAESIAVELDKGASDEGGMPKLSAEASKKFEANVDLIGEAWYCCQAGVCWKLSPPEQKVYVKGLATRIEKWNLPTLLTETGGKTQSNGPVNQAAAISKVSERIEVWISRAPEEDRPKLEKLRDLVRSQIIMKTVFEGAKNFLFGKGSRSSNEEKND